MTNDLHASAHSFSFSPREKAGMRGKETRENTRSTEIIPYRSTYELTRPSAQQVAVVGPEI